MLKVSANYFLIKRQIFGNFRKYNAQNLKYPYLFRTAYTDIREY